MRASTRTLTLACAAALRHDRRSLQVGRVGIEPTTLGLKVPCST
ncbi:MAG: hypothetical protein QOE36_1752, partial [Gaiellaceae bacterium]|nr:hypothetical protein [Gaiellaceae bacterium]